MQPVRTIILELVRLRALLRQFRAVSGTSSSLFRPDLRVRFSYRQARETQDFFESCAESRELTESAMRRSD